jgi:hypothetical protein
MAMRRFSGGDANAFSLNLNKSTATMPPADQHEEEKVQRALKLLHENPSMKIAMAVWQTGAIYDCVRRRLKGIPRSSTRGGHNKKLNIPSTAVLKEFLLMCHTLGKGASIDATIAAANSILCCNGEARIASRKWAKNWINQEKDFIKTIWSTLLSAKWRASHQKDDIKAHFEEFKRCKVKWGILDKDVYNFDKTGCLIGIVAGFLIIVPASITVAYVDDLTNRELVTSTECISAGGYHVLPMIKFKGAYLL